MTVYLDANIVIYFVEMNPVWGPKVAARVTALRAAGTGVATSDLSRTECLVGPIVAGNAKALADFAAFFADPGVQVFPVTAAVCERAAHIRAVHGFKPMDALHLAAAVEHGCTLFLTNDAQLSRFTDILVEVLS